VRLHTYADTFPAYIRMYSLRQPTEAGQAEWTLVAGWRLRTETVAHSSSNRVRRRANSLIETGELALRPNRHHVEFASF